MKVVKFYAREFRVWGLYVEDEDGNQITAAEYEPNKAMADKRAKGLLGEYHRGELRSYED